MCQLTMNCMDNIGTSVFWQQMAGCCKVNKLKRKSPFANAVDGWWCHPSKINPPFPGVVGQAHGGGVLEGLSLWPVWDCGGTNSDMYLALQVSFISLFRPLLMNFNRLLRHYATCSSVEKNISSWI